MFVNFREYAGSHFEHSLYRTMFFELQFWVMGSGQQMQWQRQNLVQLQELIASETE